MSAQKNDLDEINDSKKGSISDIKEKVIETQKELSLQKQRIQALINVLSKQGVIVKSDVDEELDEILSSL